MLSLDYTNIDNYYYNCVKYFINPEIIMKENAGDLVMKYASFKPHNIRFLYIAFFILVIAFIVPGCGGGGGGDDGGGAPTDTTAPSVPKDVNATTVSTSQIHVTWSASIDNKGVTGYRIIRTLPIPEEVIITPSTSSSYSYSNLTVNVLYCYSVTAFDAAGNESDRSSVTCAATSLLASDALVGGQFGFSVAMSGDYAIVGSPAGGSNPPVSGDAYIYHRIDPDTWDEGTKLTAGDTNSYNLFGGSVAINGDYAIVGAQFDNEGGSNAGAAYIYHKTGTNNSWIQKQKIMAQNPAINDDFGISVAISNEFAVVGATGDDTNGTNSGAIYIFQNVSNSWSFHSKIPSHDAGTGDLFGASVAISGNYLIVGATLTEAAYIYQKIGSAWVFMQRITALDVTQLDLFGISVAIDGDFAVVGAWGTSQSDGAAYIFQRTGSTWDSGVKIIATDGAADANFGKSVSIKGDYAIVGADTYDAGGGLTNIGTAYIFHRTGPGNIWDAGTQIFAVDFEMNASFGNAVTISNDHAIVGSFLKNEAVSNEGAAYIFDIPPI